MQGFPAGSDGKESPACNVGDQGSIPGSKRTHFSILAWRIPWIEEPGRPQSMRLSRVRHDWQAKVHEKTYNHENNRANSGHFKGEFSLTFN